MPDVVNLDLGNADVHVPGAGAGYVAGVELISAAKRKGLSKTQFALPSQRKYPLDTAARVRNAAARLAQQRKKGKLSPADYATARANIRRAGKRYGIKSALADASALRKPVGEKPAGAPTVHVHGYLGQGGSIHIRHMADGTIDTAVWLPAIPLDAETAVAAEA
jgi:hypothetical protein